jgi:RNase P subunit RPR2
MATAWRNNCARSGMACSECDDVLVAPKWSAYVSNHEIRHVWFCENCGHEIEITVDPVLSQSKLRRGVEWLVVA